MKTAKEIPRHRLFVLAGCAGLVAVILLEAFTLTDLWTQDRFYNSGTDSWLVDSRAPGLRFAFYTLPKILLWIFGLLLLLKILTSRPACLSFNRRECALILVTLISTPLVVSGLKSVTRMHCPSELRRYGGTEEYQKFTSLRRFPPNKTRPHCFPAGHPSGGFGLLGLFYVRRRFGYFLLVFVYGWTMGLYQMFKGAHFLSHVLVTMFLAFVLCGLIAWAFEKFSQRPPEETPPREGKL